MDPIIERIKKLLALAANNSNENEAALAAAKAQELLEEHNLSIASISRDPTKRDDKRRTGGLYNWQRKLWGSVANLNFCTYFSYKGVKKGSQYEHRVVGSEANVVATEVMADYLQTTVERLAQEWAKSVYINVFCRDAIAYREGMTERLVDRLGEKRREKVAEAERRREQQKNSSSGNNANALTILDVISTEEDLNTDYLEGLEPGTTAANKARHKAMMDAWWAKYQEEQAEKERQEKEWAAAHPLEAARKAERDAVDAIVALERARKKLEEQQRKAERAAFRRSRALTPEEQRARLSSFSEGYRKGKDIGLDDQLDAERRVALGKG